MVTNSRRQPSSEGSQQLRDDFGNQKKEGHLPVSWETEEIQEVKSKPQGVKGHGELMTLVSPPAS